MKLITILILLVNISTVNAMPEIHFHAKDGHIEEVKKLLDNDPNLINSTTKNGETPLHWACRTGREEVVKVLFEYGANVTAVNNYGSTCLHIAAEKNRSKLIELILRKGADIHAKNKEGETPLHDAARAHGNQAIKVLLKAGANIKAKNNYGHTPVDKAINSRRLYEEVLAKDNTRDGLKKSIPKYDIAIDILSSAEEVNEVSTILVDHNDFPPELQSVRDERATDSISWWLGYAVKQAGTITDPNDKDEIYGHLGRTQAFAGDIEGANASASAISDRRARIYIYIAAAKTSYKQGNISGYQQSMEHAKSAALDIDSVESQVFMSSNMIIAYLDCNDVNGAISYTETLRDNPEIKKGYHDVTLAYRKIAAHLAWNCNIEDANFIVNNNIKPAGQDNALVGIVETCVRKGNIAVAGQFTEQITRIDKKDRVYEKIGIALADSGDIKKAYTVAEKITDSTHKSSVIAAIAKYHINCDDIDLGKKTVRGITCRDHKIAVYKLIAEKQADTGKIDSAVKTIEAISKMIGDTPMAADESKFGVFDDSYKKAMVEMMYFHIAKKLAEEGNIKGYNKYAAKAIKSVKEMNDTPVWKGVAFKGIVDAQLEAGDIEGAKKTAKEIKEDHNHSWALYNIVKTQLEKDDIVGAIATYKEIAYARNKSFACGRIASAYVKKGEIAKAKQILSSLGNSPKEAEAYRETAMVFVETGHAEELADWLDEISTPKARVYACIGAVHGIMKQKNKP